MVSNSDQETVLVIGATGRHGGTGARVVERLQTAGRLVRALVHSDDDRAERLRESGVQTVVGDLHDRRTLRPALDGAGSVFVAYPVAAGVAFALANVASVIHELGSSPHVVINSHGHVDVDSPSGISREFAAGEELMLELGLNVTVLLAHSGAIRETGVFANCFGDARPAWISATDAADLCVTALLEPQMYANRPIAYPPGFERLSHQQIADIISEETGRDVRYQYITQDEWTRQLKVAAAHSGGLVNDAMIQHLPTHARTMADNTSIAGMDTDPSALAAASGRPPLTFRNFVRQHRSAFGALTATA
jgi:uncharacterized protein YbjT (DUF2867 family)